MSTVTGVEKEITNMMARYDRLDLVHEWEYSDTERELYLATGSYPTMAHVDDPDVARLIADVMTLFPAFVGHAD